MLKKQGKVVQEVDLFDGLTIGRAEGQLIVPDSKASAIHAVVRSVTGSQHFELQDQNSSNGLRVDGQRVKKVLLIPGIRVQIGDHTLELSTKKEAEEDVAVELHIKPQVNWKTQLRQFLLKNTDTLNVTPKSDPLPFRPAVKVEFTTGVQSGETYLLGWGPRHFGRKNTEFQLYDPAAPEHAFSIVRDGLDVSIKTTNPKIVKINGASAETITLDDEAVIEFGITQIRLTRTD